MTSSCGSSLHPLHHPRRILQIYYVNIIYIIYKIYYISSSAQSLLALHPDLQLCQNLHFAMMWVYIHIVCVCVCVCVNIHINTSSSSRILTSTFLDSSSNPLIDVSRDLKSLCNLNSPTSRLLQTPVHGK